MAKERLKQVWRRVGQRLGADRHRATRLPEPPEPLGPTSSLPGVPAAVLDQWPTWCATWQGAWSERQASGHPEQAQEFLSALLDPGVIPFLDEVERATDAQWDQVHRAVAGWWAATSAETRAGIGVENRVKVWLAAHDRRDDLARYCASRWFEHGWLPTTVHEGRVHAVLPAAGDAVPLEVLELSECETDLTSHVRSVRPAADGSQAWEVEVFVGIDNVSLTPDTTLRAFTETSGPLPVSLRRDHRANHGDVDGQRHQDASWGAATVTIGPNTTGTLQFTITSNGITRTGPVWQVDRRGSARQRPRVRGGTPRLEFDTAHDLAWVTVAAEPRADRAVVLDSFTLTSAACLEVTGHWHGPVPDTAQLRLVADADSEPGEQVSLAGTDAPFTVRLPLTRTRWGRPDQGLAEGRYWLRARSGDEEIPVVLSDLADAEVLDWQTAPVPAADAHQARWVSEGPERTAGLMLRNALAPDERGPFDQYRLQQQALATTAPLVEDLVYLQCFQGASASDSQLALRHEIRRTRPDLRVVWGVAGPASWTPPGDERVLLHSAEWFGTISTARFLSQNGDVDRWFSRREGQQFLATFHGYPSKTMGIGMWAGKGYTPLRIEHELARTRDVWSLIITPDESMDDYYRAQYDYDGPILGQGLPRDDLLRSAEAEAVRARSRRLLGIAEHETAVLYAPTWRDDRATDWRAAEAVLHLDLAQASAALGEGYVFLLRGHRFTVPSEVSGSARTLDVTDHPEINDLILASDAAVLDYSSLRFDFSLTGRPMIFLVPDLAEYTGQVRGFLYDYPSSAPGPLVASTAEVIEALADLPGTAARHRGEYAAFEQRFNRHMDGHAAVRVAGAWLGPGAGDGAIRSGDA